MRCLLRASEMRGILTFARSVSYLPRQKNHYEILEVARDASSDDIKKAFVRKTNELHPDGNAFSPAKEKGNRGVKKSETEKFMELKAAYDVLRRPKLRQEYDRELRWSSEASASMFYEQGSNPSFKEAKIKVKGLQLARNRHYSGPSQKPAGHFYDPNDEIKREMKQKRFIVSIGLLLASLLALNGVYIGFQSRKKRELESSRPAPLPSS
uniref:J domain-containing protein n=2 Tax=Steinernema glaseri TaxID=37863 RepID=A0A1I7ZQ59_9BILA